MNLYFVIARDEEGEDVSVFVSAPDRTEARRLYYKWLKDNWENDDPYGVGVRLILVPSPDEAKVLHWGGDAIDVFQTGPTRALSRLPDGPDYVVSSYRSFTPTLGNPYEVARSLRGGGSLSGIIVTEETEDRSYVLDGPSCIAVASLIRQGWDPRFAAALVHKDFVCALPDDNGYVPQTPEGMDWLADRVFFGDGSSWSIFADNDVHSLVPEHFDLTGYGVASAIRSEKRLTPQEAVAKSVNPRR